MQPLALSPSLKYSFSSFSETSGNAAANRCQLPRFILHVDAVTCLTPKLARVATSFAGSSFKNGIIGSMRTETAMPLLMSASTAFRRFSGEGAFGSIRLAISGFSVVIVMATVDGTLQSKSASRVTRSDFVRIWIRQLLRERILRLSRVKPVSASMLGYGSEELAIEIISPFNFTASRSKRLSRSFLGRQSANRGM